MGGNTRQGAMGGGIGARLGTGTVTMTAEWIGHPGHIK
jgi:hypothetical protein